MENNDSHKIISKHNQIHNQIINENNYSQQQCSKILQEIEQDEINDNDDDHNHNNKRRRSLDIDILEPPKKKSRVNSITPFKANKSIFAQKKRQTNRANINLPKPVLK